MKSAMLYLGGAIIAYLLVFLYERLTRTKFSDFELSISTEKKQRRIARNIIGVVRLAADAAVIIWASKTHRGEIYKPLLFYVFIVIAVLHVVNSVLALLRLGKAYKVVDIVAFIIKLVTGLALLGIMIVFERGTLIMYYITLAALAMLCTRGSNMLDGDWLELLKEDLQKD